MRIRVITTIFAGFMAGAGFAGHAHADTFSYNGYSLGGGENLHVTDAALAIDNEYGGAGLIGLNGSYTIQAYCVDLADWLLSSGSYITNVNPLVNPNLRGTSSITGDSKITDINALIANGGNFAAVQLAIWETEYGAAASFTPDDSGLQAVATGYLTNIENGSWTGLGGQTIAELSPVDGVANQTLVYLTAATNVLGSSTSLSSVPEPTTLALLGAGVVMIGGVRKRRSGSLQTEHAGVRKSN